MIAASFCSSGCSAIAWIMIVPLSDAPGYSTQPIGNAATGDTWHVPLDGWPPCWGGPAL